MSASTQQAQLISHVISPLAVEDILNAIQARIQQQGDKPYVTVARQLEILHQLNEFELGKFLLQNQGVNGYWTHYILTYPWFGRKTGNNNRGESLTVLEDFLMNHAPTMLATQQRFEMFLQQNQMRVTNDARLACIPCGMMGELLYLDYKDTNNIHLVGIDYDPNALEEAQLLAKKQEINASVKLLKQDAWQLDIHNEFDLISSNGLNIYESDEEKIKILYRNFYNALKPGGKLVTSFLTFPPALTDECEWDMSCINKEDLLLQKIIFVDIVEAKFQCFRSTAETKRQLESAGFVDVEFIYDQARIFPTVVAYK